MRYILLITALFLIKTNYTWALTNNLPVTATIGHNLKVFGYTSPLSDVEITGSQVSEITKSNSSGYFEFRSVYFSSTTHELCLQAKDSQLRSTMPVCIPTPDYFSKSMELGPVILPPSITVEKGSFFSNSQVTASGESLPNSEVSISLFKDGLLDRNNVVHAATLPDYSIKTDQNGYFSFNLPSSGNSIFRLFAQTHFEDNLSPKSNTLTFKVISIWYFIRLLILVLILVMVIAKFISKLKKKKSKALVLDQKSIQVYSNVTVTS